MKKNNLNPNLNNEKLCVNFSLSDFLGLANDERIKQKNPQTWHGPDSSVSEIKINYDPDLYSQTTEYLSKMAEKPVFLFQRTTLAHMAVLPLISNTRDAVILDQYVHINIHIAADILKSYGKFTKTIKHNKINILEEEIQSLKNKYKKIWYLTDGIHSIFGDCIPISGIEQLLNKYEQLYIYIDDSYGLSWTGKNGKGFANQFLNTHPRVLVASSLSKGFGVDGGSIICTDLEMKNKLTKFADPIIKKNPINSSTLNAIIESAKIHLSNEIYTRQLKLKENIEVFRTTAKSFELPLVTATYTPVAFFLTGKVDISQEICFNLMKKGFYLNAIHFPSVPLNSSGLRAYISLYQSKNDIKKMLKAMKVEFEKVYKRNHITISDILEQFEEKQEEYFTYHQK